MKRSRVWLFTGIGLIACVVVAMVGLYQASAVPPCSTREGPRRHAPILPPPYCSYRVVAVFPHDPEAFTQGLVYDQGSLFEGTGLRGRSSLRRVSFQTGDVVQSRALSPDEFGEGITVFGDRIYQLTWQSHIGLVYDKTSFELLRTFEYPTEGWGLTHDGQRLIMSDGTATLRFLDPASLSETGRVTVFDGRTPVIHLNELEYVNGFVYANVWPTDRIARIDPETGCVAGWIDLSGLRGYLPVGATVDVLNGIAYDAQNDWLIVTGKLWRTLFVLQLGARWPHRLPADSYTCGTYIAQCNQETLEGWRTSTAAQKAPALRSRPAKLSGLYFTSQLLFTSEGVESASYIQPGKSLVRCV